MSRDVIEGRPWPFLEFAGRMADKDETGDPLARLAESGVDRRRHGLPARDPASDITERMGAHEQVHPGRPDRKLLLPHRNFMLLDRRGQQYDQLAGKMRELRCFIDQRGRSSRLFFGKRLAKQPLECIALVLINENEPPGRELAMIGDTSGDREDAFHFLWRRAWPNELARFSRATGFQEGEGG